jgi:hypothetical protein
VGAEEHGRLLSEICDGNATEDIMGTTNAAARFGRVAIACLVLALGASAASAKPNCADGNRVSRKGKVSTLDVVGLTSDGRLVCFKDRTPGKAQEIGAISGLTAGDTSLIGIDFRVQDGMLYGVGNAGGVYTLDTTTAVATPVNTLTMPLTPGTFFGVDFNPAADRLRIVSDAGLNLRHNVNAGGVTLEDGDLSYTPPTAATGINGAAYVNNDLDANTGTTLFDLDSDLDQIALQSPPNNGSLVPTGKLGVAATAPVGFDIFSATVNGVTISNHAFASLSDGGVSGFYRVNLLTGAASLVGAFDEAVVDIAIPLAD